MADDEDDGTSWKDGAMGANQGGRIGKKKPTGDAPKGGLGSVIGGRSAGEDGVAPSHMTTGDWGGEGREPSGRGVRMRGEDPKVGERGAGAGKEADLHQFTDDEEPGGT